MDILDYFTTDDATQALDWRRQEAVQVAHARHREATQRFEQATAKRLECWGWRTEDDPRLRLQHHVDWPSLELEHKHAELALAESHAALLRVETTAKASVRAAWEARFRTAFASVESVACGELSDRLRDVGALWDSAHELGIPFPVALCDVTMSPQGLREWSENVRKALGT